MPRRLEHVEAAADECEKLGASFDYQRVGERIVGRVGYNRQIRKLFMSARPGDWRVPNEIRKNVREYVREMSTPPG